MSLKRKILFLTFVFLFLIIAGVIGTLRIHQLIHQFHKEMVVVTVLQSQCSEVRNDFDQALMAPHDYLIHGHQEEKEIFSRSFHGLKQKIQEFKQLLLSYSKEYDTKMFNTLPESHQRLSEIEKELPRFEQIVSEIFAIEQPLSNPVSGNLMEEMDLFVQGLENKIVWENAFFVDLLEQNINSLHGREHRMYMISLVMGIFAFLTALFLSFYFFRSLTVPLNQLLQVTRKIGAGDMSVRVELNTTDEFGELGHSFNQMVQGLAITNERLNSIIQGSGDAMRIIDGNFTVLQVNNEMASLCGVPVGKNRGMKCYDQFCGEHCHTETCTLLQVLSGKKRINLETIKQTTTGKEIPVEMIATPLLIEGKVIGIIESFRDITGRKNAEKEKEQLQIELLQAQKLESIGQLAAGIAHEINTPMQYVQNNVTFFKRAFKDLSILLTDYQQLLDTSETPLTAEAREHLENISMDFLMEEIPDSIADAQDGIRQVVKIVSAMKEFSHPGSDEKTAIDLNRALESTITVSRNEWKYVAEMVTDFDPDLPMVPCLPDQLNQVVLNLIINGAHAIKETGASAPDTPGTLTVTTRALDDWVELRVSDTGNGIPKEIRKRIFDPFFTTKEVGKGTGQGLAIANSMITQHGGKIDFTTAEGKGTTFIIKLPITTGNNGGTA